MGTPDTVARDWQRSRSCVVTGMPGGQQHVAQGTDAASALTLFAEGGVAAPAEVPLAGEGVAPHNVIARVALVGDLGPSHQLRVRRGLPAVLDLRQVRAGVVAGHLCSQERCWLSPAEGDPATQPSSEPLHGDMWLFAMLLSLPNSSLIPGTTDTGAWSPGGISWAEGRGSSR